YRHDAGHPAAADRAGRARHGRRAVLGRSRRAVRALEPARRSVRQAAARAVPDRGDRRRDDRKPHVEGGIRMIRTDVGAAGTNRTETVPGGTAPAVTAAGTREQTADGRRKLPPRVKAALAQAGMIAAPFAAFGLFLLCYGVNPADLYISMFTSAFGDLYGFGEVLIKATPIVLAGLAAPLPARAGMINVGGEGQLAIGALFATGAAVFALEAAPAWLGIPA